MPLPTIIPLPWIPYKATEYLETKIQKHHIAFEWGSGGSTIYLAARLTRITSIEYDQDWHNHTTQELKARGITNATIKYIPPQPGPKTDPNQNDPRFTDPNAYTSRSTQFTEHQWRAYCQAIDQESELFDIILIDGNSRPSCIKHAASKLAPGGLVIVDNMDRTYYHPACQTYLSKLERHDFYGPGPYFNHDIQWACTIWINT
jgi:predicted O-methyltransferase YrrM